MMCLDCGREMAEDRQLCQPCTSRLDLRLSELPGLYRALESHLAPGSSGSSPIRRTRAVDAPLPVVLDVLDLRGPGGLLGVLESWIAALWVGELPTPTGRIEPRVNSAVATLRRMLPYISTSFPGAGDFAREIRELHGAVWSLVSPVDPADLPRRLGYCTTEVGDGLCGAVVLLPPYSTTAVCPWCATAWSINSWLQLSAGQAEFKETA